MDDRCLRKEISQFLTAVKVLLYDADLDPGVHQHLRQVQRDISSADDHRILHGMRLKTDLPEEALLFLDRGDYGDHVSGLQGGITLRDAHLAVTLLRTYKNIAVQLLMHREQIQSVQHGTLRDPEMKKFYSSLRKCIDLDRGRESEDPRDLLRGGEFLIDDQGKTQLILDIVDCLDILRIVDPGDGLAVAGLSCKQAAEQVQLILSRDCDNQIRMLDIRLFKHFIIRTVSGKAHDIKPVTRLVNDCRIAVDHRNVMSFSAQIVSQRLSDLAASNDNYFHVLPPSST